MARRRGDADWEGTGSFEAQRLVPISVRKGWAVMEENNTPYRGAGLAVRNAGLSGTTYRLDSDSDFPSSCLQFIPRNRGVSEQLQIRV